MTNDEQLLAKAKQLDPAALQALHERFYEPVARYIQFKVGDPQTVEDLSGEVFVRVLEGLKKGQTWRESPQGWIMGIARHIVTDYYRQRERKPEVKLSEQLAATEELSPPHQTMLNERKRQLMQAIEQSNDEMFEGHVVDSLKTLPLNPPRKLLRACAGKPCVSARFLRFRTGTNALFSGRDF